LSFLSIIVLLGLVASPPVMLDRIEVLGADAVRPEIVAAVLPVGRGDRITEAEVEIGLGRLAASRLFRAIEADLAPDPARPDRVSLRVRWEERPRPAPGPGFARFLDAQRAARRLPLDLEMVRIHWAPEEALALWGIDRLPPHPFARVRAPGARLRLFESLRFSPLVAAWIMEERRVLIASDRSETTIRETLEAIEALDLRLWRLTEARLRPEDGAWLGHYAANRFALLTAHDPSFDELVARAGRGHVWGLGAGRLIRVLRARHSEDVRLRALLIALETLSAAHGRIASAAAEGVDIFQWSLGHRIDRVPLIEAEAAIAALPDSLAGSTLLGRSRLTAAALIGETSIIALRIERDDAWRDPFEPAKLLILARAVHNLNARPSLPGIPIKDVLSFSAFQLYESARQGTFELSGNAAACFALILSESPHRVDLEALLAASGPTAGGHYVRGWIALRKGRFVEAVEELVAARRLRDDAGTRYLLGLALAGAGRHAEAEQLFEILNPKSEIRNPK
jgi:tetratricopeptide (TPR) repeat protein